MKGEFRVNQDFYNEIKSILLSTINKVYQMVNFAMVEAYWNIGKSIIEEQGGNEKVEYGTGLAILASFSKWSRTAWRIGLDTLPSFDACGK